MLSVAPEEGVWGAPPTARGATASIMACAKQMLNSIFTFHLFSLKAKILFGFLSVSETEKAM